MIVDNDPGTEAERMSDWDDCVWEAETALEDMAPITHKAGLDRYARSKAAKTGETVPCGFCSRPFTKTSYQQAFCCNKGPQNCKDKFWNTHNSRGIQA